MREIMLFNIAPSVQIGPSASVCRVLSCPKKNRFSTFITLCVFT